MEIELYLYSKQRYGIISTLAVLIFFGIGCLFFNHLIGGIITGAAGLLYTRGDRQKWIERRKRELGEQFRQVLSVLQSYLSAGRSVESAFYEAERELRKWYPGVETAMIKQLAQLNRRVENGAPLEQALLDFARRSDQEDIQSFADVFVTVKRTGGSIPEVIRNTSAVMGDKLDIQRDIAVMLAQKKFEAGILSYAPFGFIALMRLSTPEYMAPLYEGSGRILMLAALLCLFGCHWMIQKWIAIQI